MKLHIIHLTDIHIKSKYDKILSKAAELSKACNDIIHEPTDVIIAVTGDMAAEGKAEQFSLFNGLVTDLTVTLKNNEYVKSVHVLSVPGNHDCDFSQETTVRQTVIQATNYRATDGFEPQNVQFVTNMVQSSCFSVKPADIIGLDAENYLSLLTQLDLDIGRVTILQLNTAWISSLNEKAGTLCMPINLLPEIPVSSSDLTIAMMHHPLWWMHPDNKHAFEAYLRNSMDVVLCGHEHLVDDVSIEGNGWNYKYLEGRELQAKSETDESGFAVYVFDETLTTIGIRHYKWENNHYLLEQNNDIPFARNQSSAQMSVFPNQNTLHWLHDLGAIIHHPQVDELKLDDLFVWPNLEESQIEKEDVILNIRGEDVYERLMQNSISIFFGGETSGKSSLAKQIYLKGINDGKCCLLCQGAYFKARKKESIMKEIESLFIDQYNETLMIPFKEQNKDERIIIIDDYEQIVYNNDKLGEFFTILSGFFGTIILLTESDGSIPFILSQFKANEVLSYRIKPFGNRKRSELIKKWYSLGNERALHEPREMDAIIDRATRVVDDLLGSLSSLVLATPVTVLSILQTIDATGTTVINGQSYAYERLVQYSLDRLADGSQAMQNIYVSILSRIAYDMLVGKKWTISSQALIENIKEYSAEKILNLNVVTTISKIEGSKMLIQSGENKYKFRYPYLYYYFCGRHIAKNIAKPEIRSHIEYMSSRLHVVEYGNIIIFICHFLNNEEVLQNILINALYTLESVVPFDFGKPYSLLDEVYADVIRMLDTVPIGSESDVEKEREREQEFRDKQHIGDGSIEEKNTESIEDDTSELGNIISALRIIDVLGQILRNYPGDISGENKLLAIEEVKELSMKIVGMMYDGISGIKDEILSELVNKMRKKNPDSPSSVLERKIKQVFNEFVFSISCSMLHKASLTLASPHLLAAINSKAIEDSDDIAMGIIARNTEMLSLSVPNYEGIIAYNRELRSKNLLYAQETLRMLVAHHLRRRHCGEAMRDKLCAEFNLQKAKVLPPIPLPQQ